VAQAGEGRGVIVGKQDAGSRVYGSNTSTFVPPPGSDRRRSLPPSACARSDIETSPKESGRR
jgi:hypothetical protein